MIKRYTDERTAQIWSDENKVDKWQDVELAVINARARLKRIVAETYEIIRGCLKRPVDLVWWKEREKVIRHDLQAFVDERRRLLPEPVQGDLHHKLTSYDTEEPAFAKMLAASLEIVRELTCELLSVLRTQALKYQHTPMLARTHGQWAQVQSFGKRCVNWFVQIHVALNHIDNASVNLSYSKISGAIGNNAEIDQELEKMALEILRLKPFPGATQIMPRVLYGVLASALSDLVLVCHQIATDIRLGARSGCPIYQEPFGKQQKGSSAMPQKKNTIDSENTEGMSVLACGYADMLKHVIVTWEERAIGQSSVERVAWPGLFHVTTRALKTEIKVLKDLAVYPDNMLQEILVSRGTYASNEAKSFLAEHGKLFGLGTEEAYRIVQLASFMVFTPDETSQAIRRQGGMESTDHADKMLALLGTQNVPHVGNIKDVISAGFLVVHADLEANQGTVEAWNRILWEMFQDRERLDEWESLFKISTILENESAIFTEVFG